MNKLAPTSALILLAVLFLATTVLSGQLLKGARVDLTDNRLYTLSKGTRNLLASLDEPVNLYFYFSEEASRDLPLWRTFANRVEEMLQEMASRADGRLIVRRIDPRPFSEAEDEAVSFGLQAVPTGRGDETLFMGIAGTNAVDGVEVLPFLQPDREAFLEYELARMIYVLGQPEPPVVGLLSGLPMTGGFDPASGQRSEPWAVYTQIEQMFDLRTITADAQRLPEDLHTLVLVHPRDLSEDLLYAIDQFVLGGGRLLVFADPFAESDAGADPSDPMAAMMAQRHSDLEPLFAAWGLEFDSTEFVADLNQAMQVSLGAGQAPIRHPAILGLDRQRMSHEDVVTAELDAINISSSGSLQLAQDAPVSMEPLLESSDAAELLPAAQLQFVADPGQLIASLSGQGERRVLAARLSGTAPSAFGQRVQGTDEEHDGAGDEHRTEGDITVIVVADTDLLSDRLWVQRQRFFGSDLLTPFADNGAFVINAIDNLLGNADLISVRSRATSARPFTRVDRLRREAEERLRATEQQLEQELFETEQRLTELQRARDDDANLAVLTDEQQVEIDRFMQQRLEIRRQLRQVRRELDQEIRALGTRLKVVNIALVPVLLTGVALLLGWRRRQRQKEVQA